MPSFLNNNKKLGTEDETVLDDQRSGDDSVVHDAASSPEEEEYTIPVPPVAEPFYGLKNRMAYFGFSQRGKSHIDSGAPCQDRCYSAYIPENGILITAVADGVGSCALSDLGADTAVHSSVEYIQKELKKVTSNKLDAVLAGSILRNALQFAYDQVELAAKANEQLLYSLQSTLTVAIYNGTDLYFGHAGDDGIVVLTEEGTLAMATTRHKGEEASSVYPLQGKTTWQFGMVPNAVAFVMATDGVLDAFVRSSFEKERVYYPFIEPIFTAAYETEDSVKQICTELFTYMSGEKYRAAVTDDLSIIAVMNLEKVSNCLPKFDLAAWNEETRQYEEKVRSALYDQKQMLPHERNVKSSQAMPAEQTQVVGPQMQTEQENQSAETVRSAPTSRPEQPANPLQNTRSPRHQTLPNGYAPWSSSSRPPQRSSQKPACKNPYSKTRDNYYDDPLAESVYSPCEDYYYGPDSRYDKSGRSHNTRPPQYPNEHPTKNGSQRGETKKRKKIRPQAIIFWTLFALVLVFLVYFGIKVIKFIMSFAWLFG